MHGYSRCNSLWRRRLLAKTAPTGDWLLRKALFPAIMQQTHWQGSQPSTNHTIVAPDDRLSTVSRMIRKRDKRKKKIAIDRSLEETQQCYIRKRESQSI